MVERQIINYLIKNSNYFDNDSLMNGKMSLLFSLAIAKKYGNEIKVTLALEHLIKSIYDSLSNKTVITSYCHGIAGIGWAFNYLSKKLILPYDFTSIPVVRLRM